MNSPLEVRHLRTLVALKQAGNLGRAGELLGLTQSALSHQLKILEDHYGQPLFERKSQPPVFTPVGERLLALAHEVLPLLDSAERDAQRLAGDTAGSLRIAVECHTCFDWLMPALSRFRPRWPEVDFDLVSGFHSHPADLLTQHKADLAIVSERGSEPFLQYLPLFRFGIVGVLAADHPLAAKPWLEARDFASETLLTYPVPDDQLDLIRQVLRPAGINPKRRTSELTNAILQLVASRKGVAALPVWAVHTYLDHHSLALRPVTEHGLTGRLWAAVRREDAQAAYLRDFADIVRQTSFLSLPGIELLEEEPA